MILSCSLLRALLIVTLHCDSAKLECVLIWSLNIYQKAWPPAVVDTGLIIRSRLSLLIAAAARVVKHLQAAASLARRRLLPISKALLRCGL